MAYGSTLGKKLKDINQGDVQVPTKDGLAAFKIICSKLDELLGLYKDTVSQYGLLEEVLQKYELECRNHIRIEQRLKIHCEGLQEFCDEYQKEITELKSVIQVKEVRSQTQEKEILQLKRDLHNMSKQERVEIGRTSSMIEKLIQDHQGSSDLKQKKITQSHQISLFTNGPAKRNQIHLRINKKRRVPTEYENNQTLNSVEERQYSSLEKIKDLSSIYSRPKSRVQENKQKSVTLHVQSLGYNIRSRSHIKK